VRLEWLAIQLHYKLTCLELWTLETCGCELQ